MTPESLTSPHGKILSAMGKLYHEVLGVAALHGTSHPDRLVFDSKCYTARPHHHGSR